MAALHLYPSSLARDAALDALPDAAFTDRHLTFNEFAERLAKALGAAAQSELKTPAQQALLLHAARSLKPEERERLAGSDAALQATAELIASWRGAQISPQEIQRAAKAINVLPLLARLYQAYEDELRKAGAWTDREGREAALLQALARCEKIPERLLPAGTTIEVHAFHRFIPFQRRLLERLAALKHPVSIHPPLAFEDATATLLATFGALGGKVVAQKASPPKKHLKLEAPTAYAEVYEIGRRVLQWIAKDGVAPAKIAVAFRDLGPYSQFIADVFRRFRIPYYERRGEPAAFQPLVRVALSAVHACVGGLTRTDVFRFIGGGPVNLRALAGDGSHSAHDLHRVALDACIDRFFGTEKKDPAAAWATRLARFGANAKYDRQKTGAKMLAAIVARLAALSAGAAASRPAAAHAAAWREFFQLAGLSQESILHAPFNDAAELNKDLQAVSALEAALDDLKQGPLAQSVPITLEEFCAALERALAEKSVRGGGTETSGVRVLNLYDLRGLSFEHLVIGGMSEGMLPALAPANPLLGGGGTLELRGALGSRAGDLRHMEPRLAAERNEEELALFRIACGAAAGGALLFTRPKASGDGTAQGPSLFWNQVDAGEPELAAAIHPAPEMQSCVTEEELDLRASWLLGGNGAAAAEEQRAAAALYARSPHLKSAAGRAAVERARLEFFITQEPPAAAEDEDEAEGEALLREPKPVKKEEEQRVAAGRYDGAVGTAAPDAAAQIARVLLSGSADENARTLSHTSLQGLAHCPFKFLTEGVYRFREPNVPEDEFTALDRGSLWHAVLAEFYGKRLAEARSENRVVARLERSQKSVYLKHLETITNELLAAAPQKMFTGHPGVWGLEREKIDAALRSWLEHELLQSEELGFHPVEIEFDFGPRSASHLPPLVVPMDRADGRSLLLEGRVDRLDLKLANPAAAVPEVIGLRVIDYKIGKSKNYKDSTKPENLQTLQATQLPVYFIAAVEYVRELAKQKRVTLNEDQLWTSSAAGFYCLRDIPEKLRDLAAAGTKQKKFNIVAVEQWPLDDMREFLRTDAPLKEGTLYDIVKKGVLRVLQGDFAVQPTECSGTDCAARFSCRFQAVPPEGDEGDAPRAGGDA